MRSFAWSGWVAFAVLSTAGCAGNDEGPPLPAGDARPCPIPSDPCLTDCGNEIGVGRPCRKRVPGSGVPPDCPSDLTQAAFCTIDFAMTNLAYCTKMCSMDAECGSGAVCRADPADPMGPKGCIPVSCVGDEDGAPGGDPAPGD